MAQIFLLFMELGGVNLLWSSEQNESDVILNLFLHSKLTCEQFHQIVSLYWEAMIFSSDCFLKTMFVWATKNQIFNCHSML